MFPEDKPKKASELLKEEKAQSERKVYAGTATHTDSLRAGFIPKIGKGSNQDKLEDYFKKVQKIDETLEKTFPVYETTPSGELIKKQVNSPRHARH